MMVIAIAAKTTKGGTAYAWYWRRRLATKKGGEYPGAYRLLLLPLPADGIDFKMRDFGGFPGQYLAVARPLGEVFLAKNGASVPASFHQDRSFAPSLLWENDFNFEPFRFVPNFYLPPLVGGLIGVLHGALDIEIFNIAAVLCFSQRNQDIETVSFLVPINYLAGRAFVICQKLAITPGIILKGNHIVLQKFNPLVFLQDGGFTLRVE